ncbi:FAD-dependent monooxygenase [Gordonia sp. NPDC003424]
MPAVHNALVIGAGVSGAAVSIELARAGVAVDLVEINADVTALGSGITLQGNSLRVFDQLGVLDRCIAAGQPFTTLHIYATDAEAAVLAEVPSAPTGGPDVPPTMGMYRPDLAGILMDRAEEVGVKTRFATTVTELCADDDGVDVVFSDRSAARYDVVIGADGIRSATRKMLGIDLQTRPIGLGIWRVFARRPAELDHAGLYYGGRCLYSGFTPTSETTLYAHLTEDACDRSALTAAERVEVVRELSSAYHGPWDAIRAAIEDSAVVHYTHAETHLLDGPWNRGRVVLIGDAVHTCPPTIAQGAAMGLEDAVVLAELLTGSERIDDRLWAEFADRRLDRVRAVVEASNLIAGWQVDREQGDVPAVMGRIAKLVMTAP